MNKLATRLQKSKRVEKLMMHSLSVQAAFIFVTIIASGFVFHNSEILYEILLTQFALFIATFIIGKELWEDWL